MIYFLKANNRIKIGYANDPTQRIPSIQTSSPFELEVLLIINGNYDRERELHQKFEAFRKSGEWFEYSEPIKNFISQNSSEDRKYEFGFVNEDFAGNEQILKLRKRHKISLESLGSKLDMTRQGVYKIQQSEKSGTISINSLKKVAEALDYTFEYRFVKSNDENEKNIANNV
jgi:hypothetical protein|tara:strand:- start:103 stop:618 length:516 start_codon:yes stop_codon:yes gene_type:complete